MADETAYDRMRSRPPIVAVCWNTSRGNPQEYRVGNGGITLIKEVWEGGEFCDIAWAEVYADDKLLSRFNQHHLQHIHYFSEYPQ